METSYFSVCFNWISPSVDNDYVMDQDIGSKPTTEGNLEADENNSKIDQNPTNETHYDNNENESVTEKNLTSDETYDYDHIWRKSD